MQPHPNKFYIVKCSPASRGGVCIPKRQLGEEYGLGIDIQGIAAFQKPTASFLKRVFSPDEIEYCVQKSEPAQHFAARFAAKEAIRKSFLLFGKNIPFSEIGLVLRDKKVHVELPVSLKNQYAIKLSLSHSGDYAVACALIIDYENRK